MKKAYVKVKTPSAKTVLKRPYIAATIIGAALCAVVLSVTIKPISDFNEAEENVSLTAENESVPTPSQAPPLEFPGESQKSEIETPDKREVFAVEPHDEQQESVSVGFFNQEIKFAKPVDEKIIKDFSGTKPVKSKTMGDWRVHSGIDIAAKSGTDVKACADGEVVRAENNSLTGATIVLDHGSGIMSTVYNLQDINAVTVGQKVKQGDVLGKAGNTAKNEMLEDAHIHFEVTKDGAFVDPKAYFN